MSTMHYKNYVARIIYDEDENIFHGRVLGMNDVIDFYGKTVDELRREFKTSVEEYLDMCAQDKTSPEKPFTGKFTLRVDSDLHRAFALAASMHNKSLNAWARDILKQEASKNL